MKKIYSLILVISIFLIGCASTLMVNKYAKKLSPDQAQYYKNEYKNSVSNAPMFGYYGIIFGKSLTGVTIASISVTLLHDDPKYYLEDVERTERYLNEILDTYSQLWSMAIDQNIRGSGITFNHALLIIIKEFSRAGLYENLEKGNLQLEKQISGLGENQFPHTYKVYGILNQLIQMAEEPKGSLLNFNQNVNLLMSELTKEKSLAKIELNK